MYKLVSPSSFHQKFIPSLMKCACVSVCHLLMATLEKLKLMSPPSPTSEAAGSSQPFLAGRLVGVGARLADSAEVHREWRRVEALEEVGRRLGAHDVAVGLLKLLFVPPAAAAAVIAAAAVALRGRVVGAGCAVWLSRQDSAARPKPVVYP